MGWVQESRKQNQRWLLAERHRIWFLSHPSVSIKVDGMDVKEEWVKDARRKIVGMLHANRLLRAEARAIAC